MPIIFTLLYSYLKSLFGFFVKHPEVAIAVVVAIVLAYFYIDNKHLKDTVAANDAKITQLSTTVSAYQNEVAQIKILESKRDDAEKAQVALNQQQSQRLTALSNSLSITNLTTIKNTKGIVGLEQLINGSYLATLICIEGATQYPPIACVGATTTK